MCVCNWWFSWKLPSVYRVVLISLMSSQYFECYISCRPQTTLFYTISPFKLVYKLLSSIYCKFLGAVAYYVVVSVFFHSDHSQDHRSGNGNEGDCEVYRGVKGVILERGLCYFYCSWMDVYTYTHNTHNKTYAHAHPLCVQ